MRTRDRTPRPAVALPSRLCPFCGSALVERKKMFHTTTHGTHESARPEVPRAGWFCPSCKHVVRHPK